MCLLVFSYENHPSYRLILLANRDEFYDRPTEPAGFWEQSPHLLAGKDLRAGGTWLGITKNGRICGITNYRDPKHEIQGAPSRGMLVKNFLLGTQSPEEYLTELSKTAHEYNGFNLIAGDLKGMYWFSNRGPGVRKLKPGLYGLSNHLLDTPWPKVARAKHQLEKLLSSPRFPSEAQLFEVLCDRTRPDDKELPNTGMGIEWERILAPIFITSKIYGTRSSTIILIDYDNKVTFVERTYNSCPEPVLVCKYEFLLE